MSTMTTTTATEARTVLARLGYTVTDVCWENGECTVTTQCDNCHGSGYVPTVDSFRVCSDCFGLGDSTQALSDLLS